MEANEKLEYAFDKTYLKYPQRSDPRLASRVAMDIFLSIKGQKNVEYFTRDGDARSYVSHITPKEFISFYIDNAIKIYGSMAYNFPREFSTGQMTQQTADFLRYRYGPYESLCRIFYDMEQNPSNLITYYQTHDNKLLDLITAVMSSSFSSNIYLGGATRNNPQYGNEFRMAISNEAMRNPRACSLLNKFRCDLNSLESVEDLRFNPIAVNRCRNEVLNGTQVRHNHNEYREGRYLFASQDIGRKKENQEDSVIISEHPFNPKYKLIAVCDGVGGIESGELASNMVARELEEAFINMNPSSFLNADSLVPYVNRTIKEISNKVARETNGQSTLTGAIVCEDKTIIMNVGDSRVYTINGNVITLHTEDDSQVYQIMRADNYSRGRNVTMDQISDLRFTPGNNVIVSSMGQPYEVMPQLYTIPNDYDKLLAMSDGVHDILSWEDIYTVASTATRPEDITRTIVSKARDTSVSKNGITVPAGKDNITAAGFIRR